MDAFPGLAPKSVVVVLGTRPEIIKLAGIVRLLGSAARVIHTGQHYDYQLATSFFRELAVAPDVYLGIGANPRGEQVGEVLTLLDRHLAEYPASAVVVQGDTNATLAGALAANARETPLVHIEAGLRSYDRRMPEEHNRVVTDQLADLCCAPTHVNSANLAAEGIGPEHVEVTGNTVIEVVQDLLPPAIEREGILQRFGLKRSRFVAATLHRPENVDDKQRLETILHELGSLAYPVLVPLHPRTAKQVAEFGLQELLDPIRVIEPLNYRAFLTLAAESAFLVSDSGGIQEEASVVKRPVIVVRNSTERPEVMGTFCRLVHPGPEIGYTANEWTARITSLHHELEACPSPYGDGSASYRSVAALMQSVVETEVSEVVLPAG